MSTSGEKMMGQMNKQRWARMQSTLPKALMHIVDYGSVAGLGKTIGKHVIKKIIKKRKKKPDVQVKREGEFKKSRKQQRQRGKS
tara:strand:+ start:3234 stop:3485 length:252 start_codon:yes stop_codon:yes gene_type:complete